MNPHRTEAAEGAKTCPLCASTAVYGFIPITGTGSSGMESPDITLGCVRCGLWLNRKRTEKWSRRSGTYSIMDEAKRLLLLLWNRREGEMLHRYWKNRADRTEQALVEARREHLQDIIAIVAAAGGEVEVAPSVLHRLPYLGVTITPTNEGGVVYRTSPGRRSLKGKD